jgi:hypothetical protein
VSATTHQTVSSVPQHVAPDNLYPNPILTTGVADTLSLTDLDKSYNGQTYSQAHRNVPDSEKNQVKQEYGNPTGQIEIDHFYPLCAGGSNDIKNLWAQPAVNVWNGQDFGFHAKDKLETYVCAQIKAGKLDSKVAYQKITSDWVAYYLQIFPQGPVKGIDLSTDTDGDTVE